MDKYRGITRLPLAESRISHLLNRLTSNRANRSYLTQEELVRSYADISKRILAGAEKRIYDLPRAVAGSPISEVQINSFLLGVYSEILYLMDSIKGTAEMTEENFNFGIATIRKLQGDIKFCRQQLSAFSLYATQYGDTLHYGETFSNETNIDRGTDLLGEEECFIDLAEGNISLPRLDQVDQRTVKEIQIGALSNGNLGNNVEANTPIRGSIKSMYDDNVDTWTEYERVLEKEDLEDLEGLKLELKVLLEEAQIVNGIKIIPVFLGARTPFTIRAIEVSQDGRKWTSLRDEVSVAEFLDEDTEHRYHLSPHSSKFSGEFSITFAPRFIKFVRLLIKQSSAFPISDAYNVRRLRYVIGLKEISLFGYKYSSAGELISQPISFTRDISALGIQSLVDPPNVPREVGGADYYISYDDGASWNQLTTFEDSNTEIPEVLFPPSETSSIRYKLYLFKNELAFAQQVQEQSQIAFSEKFPSSDRRPFLLRLRYKPELRTVTVCESEVITRGKVYPRIPLGFGISKGLLVIPDDPPYISRTNNKQLRVKLPLKNIKDPSTVSIYVNGIGWEQKDSVSSFGGYYSTEYVIERDANSEYWEVVFGDGNDTPPGGGIPTSGDEISMVLSEERCTVEGLLSPYKIKLDYTSDGIKENTSIRFFGGVYNASPETVSSGITRFKLSKENIIFGQSYKGSFRKIEVVGRDRLNTIDPIITTSENLDPPSIGAFRLFKNFVNGYAELENEGDWTVDAKTGTIYFHRDSKPDGRWEYTVTYSWEDIIELQPEDWNFAEGKLDELEIYETGYKTQEASYTLSELSAAAGDAAVTINDSDGNAITGIVPKSLRIGDGTLDGNSAYEVPFINGHTEFRSRARIQDEDIPTNSSGAGNIAAFQVTHWQNLVSTTSCFFPNDPDETTFTLEKFDYSSLTTQGDYFFDITGSAPTGYGVGYVYVHMGGPSTSIPSGQVISYQYYDPYEREKFKGAYSINSADAVLHFAESLDSSDLSKVIAFKYTPYRARYNISQELTKDLDYKVDADNQTIQINAGAPVAGGKLLAVNYKYQPEDLNTIDLAPYYSPLVRALDIKVS